MNKLVMRALALVVILLGLQAAGPAPAQAATWTQVDRVCKTWAAGTICATVQKDGTGNFRGRTTVSPASGKWLQPSWHGLSGINFGGFEYFCDPNEFCSRKTSFWGSSYQTWSGALTYTAGVKLPSGAIARVSAGASAWQNYGQKCVTVTSGKACVTLYVRSNRDAVDTRSRFVLTPAAGHSMTPTLVRAKLVDDAGHVWQADKTLSGARTSSYSAEVIKYGAKPTTSWNAFAVGRWTDAAGSHSISEDMS